MGNYEVSELTALLVDALRLNNQMYESLSKPMVAMYGDRCFVESLYKASQKVEDELVKLIGFVIQTNEELKQGKTMSI